MGLSDTIKNTKDSRYEPYLNTNIIDELSKEGRHPIYPELVYDTENNCVLIDIYNDGFISTYLTPIQVHKLIDLLENFCNTFTDEQICRYNYEQDEKFRIEYEESSKPCSKQDKIEKERVKNAGYIYLLKCENRFKIGFSKDVESRVKQLDVRPFKLELLYKVYDERAYDIEQALHKRLINYKVDGEWYDFRIDSIAYESLGVEAVNKDIIADIESIILEIIDDLT